MGLGAFFSKLAGGLKKTREAFAGRIRSILSSFRTLDEATLEQIEESLLAADVGVDATTKILTALRQAYKARTIQTADQVLDFLKADLRARLDQKDTALNSAAQPPTVILVAGVNGTGKTTSIAKLASLLKREGKKVMLCASDTFRAAAVEQLSIWSDRLGVDIVKHAMGADPAAVVFDACTAALARKVDVLIIDTAGRLQTKENLMKELSKIRAVATRKIPGAPHESLLVLDATTGQNAISQARHFGESAGLTGIFLSKLDGTAKGGIVIAIRDALKLPVKYIGTGETPEDISPFDAASFVDALFS